MECGFLIKEVFIFVKKKVILLIIFLNHLSFIRIVNFDPLVLQISDDFLRSA